MRQKRILGALDQSLLVRFWGRRLRQIVGLGRDDMAYPTPGVGDITSVPGNNVQMKMEDGLPGCTAKIEADLETIRDMTRPYDRHCLIDGSPRRRLFFGGQILPSRRVPLGYDQNVTRTYRKPIPDAVPMRPSEGNAFRSELAEWAFIIFVQCRSPSR